jgi:hypothetical protein
MDHEYAINPLIILLLGLGLAFLTLVILMNMR